MILTKVGEPIYLHIKLGTGQENRYPVAVLRDYLGNQLGSQIELTHKGEGLYENFSIPMTSSPIITASYIVYDDEALTTRSEDNSDGIDIFILDSGERPTFEDKVIAHISDDSNMFAWVDDTQNLMFAKFEDDNSISIIPSDDIVFAIVEDISNLQGSFEV